MIGVELLAAAAGALTGLGVVELLTHQRRLRRIGTRIHVSGTRGKSSVTRLIAAGLRANGRVAVAKTTGTLARTILPDGREIPLFRPAGPNIIEQTRVVAAAAAAEADALVMECMALQPGYHWISERHLVRATHGVITNARADHLDVMGPTEEDVARCLAGMIPVGGVLYTTEQRHLAILEEACEDRGTRLVAIGDDEVAAVSEDDLAGFSYAEHPENLALSLRLLADLGADRTTALKGMWEASPDPGALCTFTLDFYGREILFANGFAANDPESSQRVWELLLERYRDQVERVLAVFNLRGDRPTRTVQLARESRFWHAADGVVLMGSGAYLFARVAGRAGFDASRFTYAEGDRADDVFEHILGQCGRSTLVIGMGNIGGQGLALTRYFRNRSRLAEER